jgi:hypothetical protein
VSLKANPTVRGIQQYSKQSFQTHHPGVRPPPHDFFFLPKFIGKMLYFSVKKGIIHSQRDLNSVSSSTDKTNGPYPQDFTDPLLVSANHHMQLSQVLEELRVTSLSL